MRRVRAGAAEMLRRAKVAALKIQARQLYLRIAAIRAEYSCGAKLASFMSPRLSQAEREFAETMRKLAEVDPEAKALVEKEGTRI